MIYQQQKPIEIHTSYPQMSTLTYQLDTLFSFIYFKVIIYSGYVG